MTRRRRGWTRLLVAALVLAAAAETWAFVVPGSDQPAASDLVVVLGGNGYDERLRRGIELVGDFPGATLAVSQPNPRYCPRLAPGARRIVCFRARPFTTRGEARFAARYARAHGGRSIEVVVSADQLRRARLRFERCWPGSLHMVKSRASLWSVLKQLPYQSAASVKALVFQRSC